MEGTQGITPELYRAVIALVDDRLKEIRVTREDFDRLTQAVAQLAQAQARTDAAVQQLALRVDQLAQAQIRTEQALQNLATQVGALSENVGYGLEDIARVVLPGYLKQRYGVRVEHLERRIFTVDGQRFDVDLYAEGRRGRRRVVVLGEVKSRIYAREVHQFQQLLQAVHPHLPAEPLPLMFGYFVDLSATEAAREQILLIAAYQPTLEGLSLSRTRRSRS